MIIGFDIDGCVNNAEEYDKKTVLEYCKLRNVEPVEDFIVKEHFGMSPEYYQEYMNLYFPALVKSIPPRPFTSEMFYKLKYLGHTLVGITARDEFRNKPNEPYKGYMMKHDTLEWFEKNDIPYDNIIFSTTRNGLNKGIVCKANNIDIMLEDTEKNIRDIVNEGVRCAIMLDSKNASLDLPNTFKVKNILDWFFLVLKLSKDLKMP